MYANFALTLKDALSKLPWSEKELAIFIERRPLTGFAKTNLSDFLHSEVPPQELGPLLPTPTKDALSEHVFFRIFIGIYSEQLHTNTACFLANMRLSASSVAPLLLLCPYAPSGSAPTNSPFVSRIPKAEVEFCASNSNISIKHIRSFHLSTSELLELKTWANSCISDAEVKAENKIGNNNTVAFSKAAANCNLDNESICNAIRAAQAEMLAGNSYLLNYSVRLFNSLPRSTFACGSLLSAWAACQSRFALFFAFHDQIIMSLSPERFLAVRNNWVLAEPIKGTQRIAICSEPSHDDANLLWASEKERLEHTMIVDLLRNDLNAVCAPGSVAVHFPFFAGIAGNLLQMESFITGKLLADNTFADLLAATMPAGSITGTPKIRTCEIISRLETTSRGYYTGVFAIADKHNFDSIILIRSHFANRDCTYLGTGAGITTLSNPTLEAEEFVVKADSFINPFVSHCE